MQPGSEFKLWHRYFISDLGSNNTPGPSGNSRTHIQCVSGAQQPQQPLEPQATTSSASQHQQLIFSNQHQQPQQQSQQRASLNSNYDLSAELVQVLVNQQQQNNSETQNQLRSNSENQNQLRSTQQLWLIHHTKIPIYTVIFFIFSV